MDKISDSFKTTSDQIVVFTIDELSYALSLQTVVKVIHAIEIRPLPEAPDIICGIINVKGPWGSLVVNDNFHMFLR